MRETEDENRYALEQMRKILKADTRPSSELSFDALRRSASGGSSPV
ncbi:MAG TPA: hypothetical protein PK867_03660 [Pirellulales bacterium]|nr:hypothetical protein [Pirellulales bacterium]